MAILKTKLKAENDDKMKKVREDMVVHHNKQMAALKSELETLQAKEKQVLASDVNAAKARAGGVCFIVLHHTVQLKNLIHVDILGCVVHHMYSLNVDVKF